MFALKAREEVPLSPTPVEVWWTAVFALKAREEVPLSPTSEQQMTVVKGLLQAVLLLAYSQLHYSQEQVGFGGFNRGPREITIERTSLADLLVVSDGRTLVDDVTASPYRIVSCTISVCEALSDVEELLTLFRLFLWRNSRLEDHICPTLSPFHTPSLVPCHMWDSDSSDGCFVYALFFSSHLPYLTGYKP